LVGDETARREAPLADRIDVPLELEDFDVIGSEVIEKGCSR
jgi:hypothetical protein